jgi:hypothetical protein
LGFWLKKRAFCCFVAQKTAGGRLLGGFQALIAVLSALTLVSALIKHKESNNSLTLGPGGVSLARASTRINDRLMGGIERRKVLGRSINACRRSHSQIAPLSN